MDWIRQQVSDLCKEIRKDAIPLTDAFNYTDFMINSPLGRYNGDIYESYFNMVQTAHPPAQIPPYFKKHVINFLFEIIDSSTIEQGGRRGRPY